MISLDIKKFPGWTPKQIVLYSFAITTMGLACHHINKPNRDFSYLEKIVISQHKYEEARYDKKIAVMITGMEEERHVKNLILAYETLKKLKFDYIYIFGDEKVTKTEISYSRDIPVRKEVEIHRNYPIYAISEKKNIKNFFLNKLRKETSISENDLLFIYTSGHGGVTYKHYGGKKYKVWTTSIAGNFDLLFDKDIIDYTKDIPAKDKVIFSDVCGSGSFVGRMVNAGFLAISAGKGEEPTIESSFPQEFFTSLEKNIFGYYKGDWNNDGRMSLEEIFGYAVTNDFNSNYAYFGIGPKQNPQLRYKERDPRYVFLN